MRMKAAEIHVRLGSSWPLVLSQLGIDDSFLRLKKAGPCPACGGTDRYTFDNRNSRGDYYCRHCGAGDGFKLLERVYGWTFREALSRVAQAAGLGDAPCTSVAVPASVRSPDEPQVAEPTARVLRLKRESCAVIDCPDAVEYLAHRNVWPLPGQCALRAHPTVEYFHEGKRLGRFAALVADVRDVEGQLVTVHLTYLRQGRKLTDQEPRKLLSPLTGRGGCAVRLLRPDSEVLGIAEGIETALAAAMRHGVPTWAALNTSLLQKFEPPAGITRLVIFADRDEPGLLSAAHLMQRLQGRVELEIRAPPAPAKDWNDIIPKEPMNKQEKRA